MYSACDGEENPDQVAEDYSSFYNEGHIAESTQADDMLKRLCHMLQKDPSDCRLLDFGCGAGAFLKKALDMGMDAYGFELGDWSMADLEKSGVASRVFTRDIDAGPFGDNEWDIIHSSAVLEHVYWPMKTLGDLHRKLKPGGMLAIASIPNNKSIFVRLGIDSFDGNVPLSHLNYFSKHTLLSALQKSGLKPLYSRTWGVPLRLSLSPAKKYYQSDKSHDLKGMKDAIAGGHMANMLRALGLYRFVRWGTNTVLNAIGGGAVIETISTKPHSK